MDVFLRTERLILRPFTEDDAEALVALDSDPAVMRYINGGQPIPARITREQTLPRFLEWHRRTTERGCWAAIDAGSQRFLGWFHLRPPAETTLLEGQVLELGYRLVRAAWGHGYATEGARALIQRGFAPAGTQRIIATTLADNAASIRVMMRAGLRHVRDFTYSGPDPTAWHVGRPAVEYGLDRSEFQATDQGNGDQR